MPVPKRRCSTRRKGKRRASQRLALPNLITCPSCGNLKKSHHACPSCGAYKQSLLLRNKK